jgi:hypothetical protein
MEQISPVIYENYSHPYGLSYVEWTVIWWKWLLSIPKERSPALDITGECCDSSQHDPNVWFLAGTFGGSVTRNCKIPKGKAILFPIINYQCSFADGPLFTTERELEERCRLEIDQIGEIHATLDNELISVKKYRVHSRCFKITIPPDNSLGANSGTTTMASDGYWLFVEPLPIGNHILTSFGSCLAGRIKIGCNFHILVE